MPAGPIDQATLEAALARLTGQFHGGRRTRLLSMTPLGQSVLRQEQAGR